MVEDLTTANIFELKLIWKEVFSLFCLANKFQVSHIESVCREFIRKRLNTPNILTISKYIQSFEGDELQEETHKAMGK